MTVAGTIYRCPVCGSEVAVIAVAGGRFAPRCCNRPMEVAPRRGLIYVCPVCGAEVLAVRGPVRTFRPRCCNTPMVLKAA